MYIFLRWDSHEGQHDSVIGVSKRDSVVVHELSEGGRESGGLVMSAKHNFKESDVLKFVGGGEVSSDIVHSDWMKVDLPVEMASVTRSTRGTILII